MAFVSAREKIQWARERLSVLDEECKRFLETKPYGHTRHFKNDGFEQEFQIQIRRTPPMDIPLLCGDVLHNARAALDHAVYGLAVEHLPILSARERGRLQFPIVGDLSEFREQKRRGRLFGVPARQRTEIQRLQPYYSTWPNVWLGLLAELDNVDKHRAVHIVAGAVQWADASGLAGHEVTFRWAHPYLKEDGAEICTVFLVPPEANVEVEFMPQFHLVIESRQIRSEFLDDAATMLGHIVDAVTETLDCLETEPPDYQFLEHRGGPV
jgi:hypothetical protein